MFKLTASDEYVSFGFVETTNQLCIPLLRDRWMKELGASWMETA